MTVASDKRRKDYVGNGVLDTYAYDFIVFDKTHLEVYLDGVIKTVDVDYTVTGVDNPAGGNVVFTAPPGSSVAITIMRVVPETQLVNYVAHDMFPAETHEAALDRLVMMVHQLDEKLDRTLKVAVEETVTDIEVEVAASNYLRWNAAADAIVADLGGTIAAHAASHKAEAGDPVEAGFMESLAADPGGLGAGDAGRIWFNTTDSKFKGWDGTKVVLLG